MLAICQKSGIIRMVLCGDAVNAERTGSSGYSIMVETGTQRAQ